MVAVMHAGGPVPAEIPEGITTLTVLTLKPMVKVRVWSGGREVPAVFTETVAERIAGHAYRTEVLTVLTPGQGIRVSAFTGTTPGVVDVPTVVTELHEHTAPVRPQADASLTPYPGRVLTGTGAALVLEDVEITGTLDVKRDTIIRRFRWRPKDDNRAGFAVRLHDGATLIAIDGHIDGQRQIDYGVCYSGFALVDVHVQGFSDGIRVSDRCALLGVRHDNGARVGDKHPDAVQSTGGSDVSIRWCHLDCRSTLDASLANGIDIGNAAIMVGNENRARYPESVVERFHVGRSYLNGGNYTVSVRADVGLNDFEMVDCTFGPDHRYGPATVAQAVPNASLDRNTYLSPVDLVVRRGS